MSNSTLGGHPLRPVGFARAVAALITGIVSLTVTAASCGGSNASAACADGQRTELLRATLRRGAPSDAFTVAASTIVWISTTSGPDQAGLERFAGVADVTAFPADGEPAVTTDSNGFQSVGEPKATLRKALVPVRLAVDAGVYRLFTVTLGLSDLPVVVFACPAER